MMAGGVFVREMLNIYEEVDLNKRKSVLVIVGFIAFVIVIFWLAVKIFSLGPEAMILALILSIGSSISGFLWGDNLILSLSGARPIKRKDFFDYYSAAENLSMAAQMPMPRLYVIDSPAMNAFAVGRDPEHAAICVTSGLLAKMNRSEIEGVVGHEISHIKNLDSRLMVLVTVLVGSLSILSNFLLRGWGSSRRSDEGNRGMGGILVLVGMLLLIFSPLIGKLIQLAISRRREFFADASSAKLTRFPQGLIYALKKIGEDKNTLAIANGATAHLFISNPFENARVKANNLFNTHPPIKERIVTLEKML